MGYCWKLYSAFSWSAAFKRSTRSERFTEVFLAAKQARQYLVRSLLWSCTYQFLLWRSKNVPSYGNDRCPSAIGILSVTFVPAAVALFVTGGKKKAVGWWPWKKVMQAYSICLSICCRYSSGQHLDFAIATRVGSEFAPQLSEGDCNSCVHRVLVSRNHLRFCGKAVIESFSWN